MAALAVMLLAAPSDAQVGAGLADLNAVPEATLADDARHDAGDRQGLRRRQTLRHHRRGQRVPPSGRSSTPEQLTLLYEKAFVHVNLNTATAPRSCSFHASRARMAHEFEEYRPWVSMAQFDKEIGKYVDRTEVNRLKQYVFIPIESEHRDRRRLQDDSEPGRQHAPGIQGVSSLEDEGAVREGNRQVRRVHRKRPGSGVSW